MRGFIIGCLLSSFIWSFFWTVGNSYDQSKRFRDRHEGSFTFTVGYNSDMEDPWEGQSQYCSEDIGGSNSWQEWSVLTFRDKKDALKLRNKILDIVHCPSCWEDD